MLAYIKINHIPACLVFHFYFLCLNFSSNLKTLFVFFAERYIKFGYDFANLPSFKVVLLYLSFVASSVIWKKLFPPLSLKKVTSLMVYSLMSS